MNTPDLNARPGDLVFPYWERLKAFVNSLQLIQGAGTRLTRIPGFGTGISFDGASAIWPHPFRPSLSGLKVTVEKGLVETCEPTIKSEGQDVPVSGDAANNIPQPSLTLDPKQIDADQQISWVALEVEADKDGKLSKDKSGKLLEGLRVEVVHAAAVGSRRSSGSGSSGGEIGMQPLALITWADGSPTGIFPVPLHNLGYARTFPGDNQGVPRHFFWAV